MNYLVIEGFKDAADKFQRESGCEASVELKSIEERMKIRCAIQQGKVDEAIRLVNNLDPEV